MTSWTTLVSAEELAAAIDHCVVIDCRHDLMNPAIGPEAYAADHIPGAYFLSQDTDLAGPKNGRNGRHPLPDRDALAAKLRAAGLDNGKQLVGYDASGGLYAARLWWLARWLGHRAVAVLDGGIDAWRKAGFPVTREVPAPRTGGFTIGAPLSQAATADDVLVNVGTGKRLVIDARGPERYRGETEPLDPVAGHIPGAVNRPYGVNLRPDGRFKPAEALRAEFAAFLGGVAPADVIHQCGSGVSACHNLLSMAYAGLDTGALYAGSWSEWVSDPGRPVATGPNP
ncbi:MAG TPA: sulfurtransferase [Quisquiliibacterium sp.]|nr:sulfurtransferase [Quisquiliibacterium sp.]HPA88214.1 sulfurtransferase [Quisquiliibacterium sp.]HQN11820.1 sulfurtransferase [Quisquiliibacterium sp.]HQP67073.1 sulfurtransferase [Quisquiliibacterium sp.]